MSEIKVGSVVWLYDPTIRRYRSGKSAPDFDAMFRQITITGGNRKSWIFREHAGAGDWDRFDKKTGLTNKNFQGMRTQVLWTKDAVLDRIWVYEHKHEIAERVRRCEHALTLRGIDKLLKEFE